MKMSLRSPCRECPFRRCSIRGFLGRANAEGFLNNGCVRACHMTVNPAMELERALRMASYCAGSLQFMANWRRLPVEPHHAAAARWMLTTVEMITPSPHGATFPGVFSSPFEFIEHHRTR